MVFNFPHTFPFEAIKGRQFNLLGMPPQNISINHIACCLLRENTTQLIEQARCLSHLSHVYHMINQNKRSLMAALEQLNAVEEADEDFHEVRRYS